MIIILDMRESDTLQEVERRRRRDDEEEEEEGEGKSHRRSLVLRGGEGEQSCNVSRCFSNILLKWQSYALKTDMNRIKWEIKLDQ